MKVARRSHAFLVLLALVGCGGREPLEPEEALRFYPITPSVRSYTFTRAFADRTVQTGTLDVAIADVRLPNGTGRDDDSYTVRGEVRVRDAGRGGEIGNSTPPAEGDEEGEGSASVDPSDDAAPERPGAFPFTEHVRGSGIERPLEMAHVWLRILDLPLGIPPFGRVELDDATVDASGSLHVKLEQHMGARDPVTHLVTLAPDRALVRLESQFGDGSTITAEANEP
ncbi:MAG TPA: hypothetical protein VK116_05795 [Planctomycetota bacterium]|nr:hypothetical protein [Planctomycetota bacterium]